MASIEIVRSSDGTGPAAVATVQSSRSIGATTIDVDTVAGWNAGGFAGAMGTPHTFTDPVTSEEITVISEATLVEFTGHIDSGNIEIDDIAPGFSDLGSAVGDIVIIRPTTQYGDNLADVLDVSHEDDGTLNAAGIHQATPAGVVLPYAGSSAPTGYLLCDGSSVLRSTYADLFTAIGTTFGSVDGSHFTLPDLRGRTPVGVGANTWTFTFASTDVNTGTDQIAVTANPELITGRKVRLTTTGTLPTGLALATDYYIIVIDSTHIKLASSLSNAVAGTGIDITGAGSGTNTATHTGTTRTLGEHGGETTHADTVDEMPAHQHSPGSGIYNNSDGATGGAQNTVRLNAVGSNNFPSTGFSGNSNAHNNMQPYLGLNYIIKT